MTTAFNLESSTEGGGMIRSSTTINQINDGRDLCVIEEPCFSMIVAVYRGRLLSNASGAARQLSGLESGKDGRHAADGAG
ncbi:hypothetical protein INS49_005931 [Diaporthe citri]|uniref:uncharacterized protein n=1 Tax=Diaporthe citri TaxID=83186 RepID=UPI001C817BA1|nr:uncharacterized protein INS49_005931 [Diaporthe citri]KAG6364330.1 hypothetical protein INS49_005931 [Diaporthe citri]